jgi:hypothetical protein
LLDSDSAGSGAFALDDDKSARTGDAGRVEVDDEGADDVPEGDEDEELSWFDFCGSTRFTDNVTERLGMEDIW